jgi:hypothetical protein
MKKNDKRADLLRLRALGRLAKKELDQARIDIGLAAELCPEWESVRTAKAIIEYYSALSPAAVPDHLVDCPAPVDWSLVRREPASREYLRSAAKAFQRIVQDSKDEPAKRRAFEVWQLACMVNDPESQERAAEYCHALLMKDPGHHIVTIWALARRLQVDLSDVQVLLETKVSENVASVEDVVSLLHIYLKTDASDKALPLLTKT